MKKFFFAIFTFALVHAHAQVFKVDTLLYHGSTEKYINLVVMGDGYTASEQDSFVRDADKLSAYLLSLSPWKQYAAYFNVFAIRVISNQSGVSHPNNVSDCGGSGVPVMTVDNYFGSTFDAYNIHRLLVAMNSVKISAVLADNFPDYDQVVIVGNTPYYGGSGGAYSTLSVHTSSNEIMAHELGHSFAKLSDEYYAGNVYANENANMTQETDTLQVKWKNWIGHNGTGVFQHCCGGNSALWYRPHENCKMRFLDRPYCSVCSETIVETIHKTVDPVLDYMPVSGPVNSPEQMLDFKLLELMRPVPNTLKVTWTLDGEVIAYNQDSIQVDQLLLASGEHTLVAMVTDTTALVRTDDHESLHASIVSWTIQTIKTGLQVEVATNKIACTMYPNPANTSLEVSIDLDKGADVSVTLLSADGKTVLKLVDQPMEKGLYKQTMHTSELAPGMYLVVFRIGQLVYTERLVKQ